MRFVAHLGTDQIFVLRKVTVSGHKTAFATTTGFIGNLQALSPERVQLFDGVVGKTFMIYTDGNLDIQEGDKLRNTESSQMYKVANGGVTRKTMGSMDFLQVVIQESSGV